MYICVSVHLERARASEYFNIDAMHLLVLGV